VQKLASCAAAFVALASPGAAAGGATAEQVRAYCARVGDDDRTRTIPPALARAAIRLFGLASEDVRQVERSTVRRCMDGAVLLCTVGANLSCSKADVSRVSKGVQAYCRVVPGSPIVPRAATGHDTIHTWECDGRAPRVKAAERFDERGFIARNWRRLD
jgi:hypothetical protein